MPKNMVCKLKKFIYGLKQASHQWNQKLNNTLIDIGFSQSKFDYSVFTQKTNIDFTIILVYVDDLILAGTNMNNITAIKSILDRKFNIKDLSYL